MAVTQIVSRQIKDAAIITAKIADTAVTFAKLNVATNPGLEDSTGIRVKVDGTTIDRGASGIVIKAGGVGSASLGILTTKGDLMGFSTVHGRLPVGTDGQVLIADAASTFGIKWNTFTGVSTSNFVYSETPSGTVNGTNPTFVLANTPTSGTQTVYVNGIRNQAGSGKDYTIATATLTFLTGAIPETGDVILVDYMK